MVGAPLNDDLPGGQLRLCALKHEFHSALKQADDVNRMRLMHSLMARLIDDVLGAAHFRKALARRFVERFLRNARRRRLYDEPAALEIASSGPKLRRRIAEIFSVFGVKYTSSRVFPDFEQAGTIGVAIGRGWPTVHDNDGVPVFVVARDDAAHRLAEIDHIVSPSIR